MLGLGHTSDSHDFYASDAAGQVWNGAAFVAWSDADFASYRIAATQAGASGRFTATAPSDTVSYEMRARGATLAASYVVWSADLDIVKSGARLALNGRVTNLATSSNSDDIAWGDIP
jgi:hypothetical protein